MRSERGNAATEIDRRRRQWQRVDRWATASRVLVDEAEHFARLYDELGTLQADDVGAIETPDRVI